MPYVPTIGLEIHAELKTQTKMFCNSKNDSNEKRPNVNICPVCLAHPGTLPVINREAVRHVLTVGVALGGKLADYTEFDRKNYFYPDLPKGYQISQYEYPLISGGSLKGVAVTRIHLEEDTASSIHNDDTGETLIDYNRSGVPLMELVTEPVIKSAREAGDFARELQLLLRYLGASEANMEKGEMRVEANISIQATGNRQQNKLGTKVEIKNLNSFRAMEKAVEYEIKRQSELLKGGGAVAQETRGWDEAKQATFSQRTKEGSADYRYFPDPDLPSLRLSEIAEFSVDGLHASMPELPWQKRERYLAIGIKREDADMFVARAGYGALFDRVTENLALGDKRMRLAANFIANNLAGVRDSDDRDSDGGAEMPMNPENLRELIDMVHEGRVTAHAAKELLELTLKEGRSPSALAAERGLLAESATENIAGVVEAVITSHTNVVEDYRKGKKVALQFLVGQSMKKLKGSDPVEVRMAIERKLGP